MLTRMKMSALKLGPLDRLATRALVGGIWAFGGRVLSVILSVVVAALLARQLTPSSFGTYYTSLSLVMLLALLSQFGTNQAVVRLIAESIALEQPARARAHIRAAFLLTIGISLFIGVSLQVGLGRWLAGELFGSETMRLLVGLLGVWILVLAIQGLQGEVFRGFHDIPAATAYGGLVATSVCAAILGAAYMAGIEMTLSDVAATTIAAGVVSILLGGVFLRKRVRSLPMQKGVSPLHLLSISVPLLISGLTTYAATHADVLILGMLRPHEEVGLYAAASKMAMFVGVPLMVANSVLPPLIAEYVAKGKHAELENLLRLVATWSGCIAAAIATIFLMAGSDLLGAVYGPFYGKALPLLLLLTLGQVVNVWAGSCAFALAMTGHHRRLMWIALGCSIGMVTSLLVFVETFGAMGVASIVGLTVIVQNVLMAYTAWKVVGIRTYGGFSYLNIMAVLHRMRSV